MNEIINHLMSILGLFWYSVPFCIQPDPLLFDTIYFMIIHDIRYRFFKKSMTFVWAYTNIPKKLTQVMNILAPLVYYKIVPSQYSSNILQYLILGITCYSRHHSSPLLFSQPTASLHVKLLGGVNRNKTVHCSQGEACSQSVIEHQDTRTARSSRETKKTPLYGFL
ncbi:hypothetical protein AD945_03695 [Gluconobacter albidus]|uniref:Uncharacterized protein n=1 Tax=Gluconobacter albidus TaxID=318683 RepID=A0A149TLT0_9PROT|nr:hypothetical protein AD945_03695 [Gluconobacter albidus]